jgi:hypothetical protein
MTHLLDFYENLYAHVTLCGIFNGIIDILISSCLLNMGHLYTCVYSVPMHIKFRYTSILTIKFEPIEVHAY